MVLFMRFLVMEYREPDCVCVHAKSKGAVHESKVGTHCVVLINSAQFDVSVHFGLLWLLLASMNEGLAIGRSMQRSTAKKFSNI